ncbi:DUF3524 domain-containing protein [Candidatus Marinimicrobia bacterium]|nr:DUF3524 domain-containing protein [Candidatus Neomarinimicrobiota bacterium]
MKIKILLIEPYYTGSHKQWADNYKEFSENEVKILSLKGQFWKWRMHGGAVTLSIAFNQMDWEPDIIIATDMLDLTTFISLTLEKVKNIPFVLYFHENQITYPWSPKDRDIKKKRDSHYGFINYSSALVANKVLFNSNFHMNSFLESLTPFLKHFPDNNELESIDLIREKSSALHIGMDLKPFDKIKYKKENNPTILWNHRWEYDKNPEYFFSILKKVKNNGHIFNLIILGENFSQVPKIFEEAKEIFKDNIIHWGYAKTFSLYAELLWKADILPVTSNQEFFGVSVMEAIYCDTWPILPNRLTYPELLPPDYHKEHIYLDEADFYNKVVSALVEFKKKRGSKFGNIASEFRWEKMATIYDDTFETIFLAYKS